jgi:hypothetical protein
VKVGVRFNIDTRAPEEWVIAPESMGKDGVVE